MIDTAKTLSASDSFTKTENIVLRMYTLLKGSDDKGDVKFTIESAGLYSYLVSWRNDSKESDMFHCVWLSREVIYAQTGIGRKPFEKHLRALIKFGLVTIRKSSKVVNKQIFVVHDPMTEAEFRIQYPDVIKEFTETLAEISKRTEADAEQFVGKRELWKDKQAISEDVSEDLPDDCTPLPAGTPTREELDQLFTSSIDSGPEATVTLNTSKSVIDWL